MSGLFSLNCHLSASVDLSLVNYWRMNLPLFLYRYQLLALPFTCIIYIEVEVDG